MLYGLQIYNDFAGYSEMARGSANLMGFDLMRNFRHPYFARNISEFWTRWHISLSTWLRDYLYIPLGGNRKGPRAHLRQPDDHDAPWRALARRELELRHLGRAPRHLPVREPRVETTHRRFRRRPHRRQASRPFFGQWCRPRASTRW